MSKQEITKPVNRPQHAGTARTLNAAEPTIVPIPMSHSVTKVPIKLINSSGDDVPTAII